MQTDWFNEMPTDFSTIYTPSFNLMRCNRPCLLLSLPLPLDISLQWTTLNYHLPLQPLLSASLKRRHPIPIPSDPPQSNKSIQRSHNCTICGKKGHNKVHCHQYYCKYCQCSALKHLLVKYPEFLKKETLPVPSTSAQTKSPYHNTPPLTKYSCLSSLPLYTHLRCWQRPL